jgi:hypothetical protein
MNYEKVILEMQRQIQQLTQKVEALEAELTELKCASTPPQESRPGDSAIQAPAPAPRRKNGKVSEAMLIACYKAAKEFKDSAHWNIPYLADRVATKTGMNRNNAVMTILAAHALLEGELFKRTLSGDATAFFLERIRTEYGNGRLQLAIGAVRKHVAYRRALHHNADKLERICDQFQAQIK